VGKKRKPKKGGGGPSARHSSFRFYILSKTYIAIAIKNLQLITLVCYTHYPFGGIAKW
jgi:hypothetical protein